MIEVKVLGIEQTVRNLESLSKSLQTTVVRQALRAAMKVIATRIKADTYGPGRQRITGLLSRSQGVSTYKDGDDIKAKLRMRDVDVSGPSKLARLVRGQRHLSDRTRKYRAFYWWFLEHGTGERHTAKGANRGAVSARPWVVPDFESTSNAALDAFNAMLARRVDEESAKLPKEAFK